MWSDSTGRQHPEIYLGETNFYQERMNEILSMEKNLDIRDLAKGIVDGNYAAVNEDNTIIIKEESVNVGDNAGETNKQDIDDASASQHKTPSRTVSKGYECQQCDKAFNDSSNLRRHVKSVHKGVKYNITF